MMIDHQKFRVPDQSGGKGDFFAEVNWNPEDKETNECGVIKFTFPDKTQAYVKREHLHAILFAMGSPSEQKKMIPTTLTKTRWYETVVSVTAKKDIYKGEQITFPIKLSLPLSREEVIGGFEKPKESQILLPK